MQLEYNSHTYRIPLFFFTFSQKYCAYTTHSETDYHIQFIFLVYRVVASVNRKSFCKINHIFNVGRYCVRGITSKVSFNLNFALKPSNGLVSCILFLHLEEFVQLLALLFFHLTRQKI